MCKPRCGPRRQSSVGYQSVARPWTQFLAIIAYTTFFVAKLPSRGLPMAINRTQIVRTSKPSSQTPGPPVNASSVDSVDGVDPPAARWALRVVWLIVSRLFILESYDSWPLL